MDGRRSATLHSMVRPALASSMCAVAIAIAACSSGKNANDGFGDAGIDATAGGDSGVADALFPGPRDASLFEAGCAIGTARAIKDPIYVLMVLDGSGSMLNDSKWNAVVPALDLFIDDLATRTDTSFGLGLTIFSDKNDPTMGAGPYPSIDVPIAVVDFAQALRLHQRVDGTKPYAETPTLAVLTGQNAALAAFAPSLPLRPGGKKALVLMTDGVPNPNPDVQKPQCVQAVKDAFALASPQGPITTLAVGIGHFFPYAPTDYDQQFVGQMAVAGGAPNEGCDAEQTWDWTRFCHFQVTPNSGQGGAAQLEQEFLLAFDKIRSRLASCELTLEKVDGGLPVEPGKVNVVFTDDRGYETVVPEDGTDGWQYDDPQNPSKVILSGKACTDLKTNVHGKVDVVLGCKTIVR